MFKLWNIWETVIIHNMVTFSVHHEQEIPDSTTLFRDYCKGDYQSIRKEFADIDWDVFMSEDMINCWSKFRFFAGS